MMPTIRPGNTPRSSVAAAGIARMAPIEASRSAGHGAGPRPFGVTGAPSGSCMYISTITRR